MIKCAICHREKTRNNHWWTLEYNLRTRSFYEYPSNIEPSSGLVDIDEHVVHVCGIEHLQIAESRIRHGEEPFRKVIE